MAAEDISLTPAQMAKLSPILDRIYDLQLERINGERAESVIDAEIEALIQQRNAIRSWGWNTGRNWKDDVPPDILERLFSE